MTTPPGPDVNGQADERSAKTIPVKLPTGRTWNVPAWMASELIERFMADEMQAWVRVRTTVECGEKPQRPGRRAGSTTS